MNATVLIVVWLQKSLIQILNCQISHGLNQPVNRIASTAAGFKLQQTKTMIASYWKSYGENVWTIFLKKL